jgi:hypothetical protein
MKNQELRKRVPMWKRIIVCGTGLICLCLGLLTAFLGLHGNTPLQAVGMWTVILLLVIGGSGTTLFGVFGSQKAVETVLKAIWDAI